MSHCPQASVHATTCLLTPPAGNYAESMLEALPFTLETTMAFLVLVAGLVQGMMAATTNWARVEYKNPWPHTFCLEKNPDS